LKMARDRLKQLAEDKDELLGILTHDMKSHLGGIQMSAELLRDRTSSEDGKQKQLCENICRSTGQLLSFVKEFLANSAADHGLTLKTETLNLSDKVMQAVRHYQEVARRKDLEIRTAFPNGTAFVLADPVSLSQVLDNLLSNAIKFSPAGKQILVTVRPAKAHFECLVQDQGPGFSSEDKSEMFLRYRRLSARPTAGEPSTGLGLSIVKKLVQGMNGEITCQSTAGHGATLIVRLPRPTSAP